MINFDTLPQENPFSVPEAGLYKAEIIEAKMQTPKPKEDGTIGADYLSIQFKLYDRNDEAKGTLYDMLFDSDKQVLQYKLGRFVSACNIPLHGSMTLMDLSKLIKGKKIALDVAVGKDSKGNPRAQVDVFSHGAYYTPEEYEEQYNKRYPNTDTAADFSEMNTPDGMTEDKPFDAPDGAAKNATEY